MEWALREVSASCRAAGVAAIVGMEWVSELGLENRAFVVGTDGEVLGHQSKNQITPGGESEHYVPDGQRRVFQIGEVVFGIVICHEGWRYPETVRWAAVRGAQIIFQPQWTGNDRKGRTWERWGESFYEKAMECRAQENTVYFASVNHALRFQNSATSLIDPHGALVASIPYGEEDLLVADIDLEKATRFYARRFDPSWYPAK
jgi:predicted amidohydrolase